MFKKLKLQVMSSNQGMATPSMEVKINSEEIQRLLRWKKYFLTDGRIQKLCAIRKYIISKNTM